MKYWDFVNGKVTDDPEFAPIVDGKEIYIETYELRTGMRIDIAYTEETKQLENMYYYRKSVLAQHHLTVEDLGNLVRLAIPHEKYEEVMNDG
jgi:hypothetical protein